MSILFTGSTGFLGQFAQNRFQNEDIIWGTTNPSTSDKTPKLRLFQKNYSDIFSISGIEKIVHLAAAIPSNFDTATFENTAQPNLEMMRNLTEFSRNNGVKRFVYASTLGSMESSEKRDLKDYYTLSKLAGEDFCRMMTGFGCPAISLRITSPYGEYSKGRKVLNLFIEKALAHEDITLFGTGAREQNFLYAGDFFDAVEILLQSEHTGVYDLGSPQNTTMKELAETAIRVAKSSSKIIFANQTDPLEEKKIFCDTKPAQQDFQFLAKTSLEDGMTKQLEYMKSL